MIEIFQSSKQKQYNYLSRNQTPLREHKRKLMLKGSNYGENGRKKVNLISTTPLPNIFVVPKAIIHKVMEIKTW